MSDTLYIQTEQNVQVGRPHVYLQDVAELSCSNSRVLNQCRVIPVLNLEPGKPGRYVMTISQIIRRIQEKYDNLDVSHIGEPVFLVTYAAESHGHRLAHAVKTALICLVTFFGTAFSIMTFNNDVDIGTLFDQLYTQFTGEAPVTFSVLSVGYSLGIGVGVLFFFNHFGRTRISSDPTPMEVQMRLYENDVNTTIIEEAGRQEDAECGDRF